MTATLNSTTIPGYIAGTWHADVVHSDVSFSVRHMMVSKVRGHFEKFEATIVTAENPLESTATATIELASINTKNEQRDNHVRSADFFDVENHPTMTYRSTGVRAEGDHFIVDGELTLKGVTKNVPLTLEINGFTADPYGGQRAGFSATAEISRSEFGVDIAMPMETGGVVVGDKVSITLEIEGVLAQ